MAINWLFSVQSFLTHTCLWVALCLLILGTRPFKSTTLVVIVCLFVFRVQAFLPGLANVLSLVHPQLLYFSTFLILQTLLFRGKSVQITWYVNLLLVSIILGGWWAAQEYNWGGWWNWDGVEVPIMIASVLFAGLLHSGVVSRSRGISHIDKACIFALTCFLAVRFSSKLSVHSFTSDKPSAPTKDEFTTFLIYVASPSLWLTCVALVLIWSTSSFLVYKITMCFFAFYVSLLYVSKMGVWSSKSIYSHSYLFTTFWALTLFNGSLTGTYYPPYQLNTYVTLYNWTSLSAGCWGHYLRTTTLVAWVKPTSSSMTFNTIFLEKVNY